MKMKSVKMKWLIAGLLFVLMSTGVYSQTTGYRPSAGSQTGAVIGKVIDKEADQPMEFTSIALYQQRDSSLVTGSISSQDGSFQLKDVPYGRYYLVANFMGYEKENFSSVTVSPKDPLFEVGEIFMKPSTNAIDEVEIIADQSHVEYKIDRKVITVSQDINAATGTAADVLQNTPSVSVDIDGNVSLRGSGNFTVLIDGKPTSLSGSDALQQIPASAIRNVEIITNPSAKYDPDGMAGIINIVSKKNALQGLSGIFNARVGTGDKYSGDFLLTYRTEKFNVYGGLNYRDDNYSGGIFSKRTFEDEINPDYVVIEGERNRNRGGFEGNFGFDYSFDDNNSISFSSEIGNHQHNSGGMQQLHNYDENGSYDEYFVNDNSSGRKSDYYNMNLSYTRTFNQPDHKLTAYAYFSNSESTDQEEQIEFPANSDYQRIDEGIPKEIRTSEIGDGQEFRFQADYTLPLGEDEKLEAGYQARLDFDAEDYLFEDYDPDFNEWIINEQFSSGNDFYRNIQAMYTTYSSKIGNFQYQLGLRGEYTDRSMSHLKSDEVSSINRFDLFPTVHVSRAFRNSHQLMLSYSRRIDRPRSWYLEPFQSYMNSNTIREGNPDLLPEYMNSFEIGYQKSFGKSFIAFETYFKNTVNKIERIQKVYDADKNITLVTIDNISDDHSLGSELMINYANLDWLELNLSGSVYRYWLLGEIDGENIDTKSNNWNLRLNSTFNITKKTRLQLMTFYDGPSATAQGEREGFFFSNIALRQDFLDRKLSATLQLRDIFGTAKYEFTSYGPGFSNHMRFTREPQIIMLSVSYKLNNYRQKRSERNGDDMNMGGGEGDMF